MGIHRVHTAFPKTANPISLTARQVATTYGFPLDIATGKGCTAGLIELGGGYRPQDVAAYFASVELPLPYFGNVNVGSGSNQPGDPNGADGEVQSDMIVAGSVAPGALYQVYFADNSNESFLAALQQATTKCNVVAVSWGSAESNWDTATMQAFEQVIKAARDNDVPVFVAAGDNGPDDGTGSPEVDFPASSPSSIGCGGTRLILTPSGLRASETVWDDDSWSSASGGGVSRVFPNRTVPDIAGNADPDTGYQVSIDGQAVVIGGTSLVAPLMLGLYALLFELAAGARFDFMSLLSSPNSYFSVSTGRFENDLTLKVPNGLNLVDVLKSE